VAEAEAESWGLARRRPPPEAELPVALETELAVVSLARMASTAVGAG
jgi:hypothetical protein